MNSITDTHTALVDTTKEALAGQDDILSGNDLIQYRYGQISNLTDKEHER